jgi:imidazolonepropionase-like amidohydrolase
MSTVVAGAAVADAHRQGRLVFAHPSNLEGARIAAEAGVDVLAHTTSDGKPWSAEVVADLVKRKIALIPTLKLWRYEIAKAGAPKAVADQMVSAGGQQTAAFAKAGGQVLFGTDVGYMTDYDPTEEYVLMAEAAGLTAMQILSTLTTAPAQRFNEAGRRGALRRHGRRLGCAERRSRAGRAQLCQSSAHHSWRACCVSARYQITQLFLCARPTELARHSSAGLG